MATNDELERQLRHLALKVDAAQLDLARLKDGLQVVERQVTTNGSQANDFAITTQRRLDALESSVTSDGR